MSNSTFLFTVTEYEDEFWIGILYAVSSFLPIPFSLTLIFVLIKDKELRRNPSYQIIVRLLVCDVLQLAGCTVTVVWLMSYPLTCELAIFRALVVTGKCNNNRLPKTLQITETIFWLLLLVDFVFCWQNQAVEFWSIYWDNDPERLFGQIANILEVYFGLPALLIAYIIYVSTLLHLVVKKKQFGTVSDRWQEYSLFFQTTFESIYCFFLVILWHTQDDLWPELELWGGFVTCLAWIIYFYWRPVLLIACNKTVRTKWLFYIFCLRRKQPFVPVNNKGHRGSVLTSITPL